MSAVETPVYVIGRALNATAVGALPAFARAAQTEQVKNLRNVKGKPITLDGLEAYELIADATDSKSGQALRFYQVIAPQGGHYFIAQGLVGPPRAEEMLAEFRHVTHSFKRTR